MARLEPRVVVEEVIKDFPTLLSVDGSTNLGCVVVSEVGPQLAYVNGPDTFLRLYTKDGKTIPRNADISFINAYYLSFVASLVVVRSMNSDVKGAVKVYKNADNTIQFVDTLYNGETELNRMTAWNLVFTEGVDNRGIVFQNTIYYIGDLDAVKTGLAAISNGWTAEELDLMLGVKIDDFGSEKDTALSLLASLITADGSFVGDYTNEILNLYYDENTDAESPQHGTTPSPEDPIVTLRTVDIFGMTFSGSEPTEQKLAEPTDAPVVDPTEPSTDTPTEPSTDTPTTTPTEEPEPIYLFTVISKTAGNKGTTGPYSINLTETRQLNSRNVFDLVLDGEAYVVSLDPEATDNSGMNCYIEVLNNYTSLNFTVKAQANETVTFSQSAIDRFGNGLNDPSKASSTVNLTSALSVLDDQELYKVHGLASLGITNVQFIKTFCTLGWKRRWFAPWDVPYDRENYNSISAYGANMPDDYNNYGMGPFDKNTGLTGWLNYIAGTTLYWERVMRNKALRSEFAPVFDENTGVMAYTAPVKLLTKSVREKLLSLKCPINWVIYNQNSNSYYMNDNYTHYSKEDILNEECNVRMTHKISNDLQDLMGQFKAKYNNEQTRQNVYDMISLYFQQNIMNQNFKPEEFMIICDRSNNTDDIIRAGKLAVTVKIRLYHSIKEITVLNEVYSVGGAAFAA